MDGQDYVGDIYVVDDLYMEQEDIILGTDLLCGVGRFLLIGDNKCTIVPSLAESAEANKIYANDLISEFKECFAESMDCLGVSNTVTMEIHLTTQQPISQRVCRIPFAKRPIVTEMIQNLLKHKIIRHSTSPYSSQLVIVKKSSGEDRLCVDYRQLNAATIRHPHPMPVIEDSQDNDISQYSISCQGTIKSQYTTTPKNILHSIRTKDTTSSGGCRLV